jgi:hypothetical protein
MLQENDNIFKSMKDITFDDTISHQCGVTMNDSVEARAIADVMGRHEHIRVTYMPAMIRIDGDGKMEFKMDIDLDALRSHGHDRRQYRHAVRRHERDDEIHRLK